MNTASAARSVRFDQLATSVPPILHLTFFHPLDDHYGLAPIEAAAVAVDTHNSAARWNKALLDNAARPSGALVFAARQQRAVGPAVRPAEARARRDLHRHRECRPADAAGRRARLEGDVADAEGHGFPRGQTHRGARNRARLRRAADAARHSRRQHLCQLRRGQPHVSSARPCCRWPRASARRSRNG